MTTTISRRKFLAGLAATGAASALAGCSHAPGTGAAVRSAFDLLIVDGTLIDGTGGAARRADLGIRGGRIAAIGALRGSSADRVIDAAGLTVVPGFIDIHSHADTELLVAPKAESKVRQGVTTEVSGADGGSAAPVGGPERERQLRDFREEYGFECPYTDMDGYFRALERNGTAQNIVSTIGLGTVREAVVGMDDRPATPDELRRMQEEVLRAVEQGCWGVSTGLEYTPGSFATEQEIAAVTGVLPERYRLYSSHIRNEDNTLLEAIEEAVRICRAAGARLQVAHLKASYRANWHKQEPALRLLDRALAEGMSIHADRYPYVAYSTDLAALFPLWAREGGRERFLGRLRDPGQRERIRGEVLRKVNGLGSWDAVMVTSVRTADNRRWQGMTVQQCAEAAGADPYDWAVQLLLAEQAEVGMVGFGMDEEGTAMVLAWRNTMVASDGGSYSPTRSTSRPHPRAYGTFPRAIARYQREMKIVSLEEMIRKMTSLPAEQLGLRQRGVLAEGKAADVVVFDYQRIEDRATFVEPHQFPAGIPYVVINGVPVVDGDRQTEALPGKVLRSGTEEG